MNDSTSQCEAHETHTAVDSKFPEDIGLMRIDGTY